MLLRSLVPFRRPARSELWALRGVDLDVEPGETIGVLGRNGSGKTTMLRLLCGVSRPTEGHVRVHGRVAPLIGVGVGFRREMSGRENVFLNGMLLGLRRDEVVRRFDDIVAFAELERFIDTPVKFYSSGMYLRLGFSVAIHTEPDVLLLDEILAVGDLSFQLKCVDRMRSIQESGTTIVIVSHSLEAIRALCQRAVLLRAGAMDFDGDTESAIARYHEQLSLDRDEEQARSGGQKYFAGGAEIVECAMRRGGEEVHYVRTPETLEVVARVRFRERVEDPVFGMQIFAQDGRVAYGRYSDVGRHYRTFEAGDEAEFIVRLEARLAGGSYRAEAAVLTRDGRGVIAHDPGGVMFFVEHQPGVYGTANLGGSVSVDGASITDPEHAEQPQPDPAA